MQGLERAHARPQGPLASRNQPPARRTQRAAAAHDHLARPPQCHRRASLRLPNGCLSPMAFQPVPRSQGATPAAAGTGGGGAAGGRLLLPSQEVPVTFTLLWEQQLDAGGAAA